MISLSPTKQALLALKQMQQKLADLEQAKYEPIAVVGMGCRFPGGDNPDAYWQLLENNVDAITEVPPQHWDAKAYYDPNPSALGKICTPYGGFVPNLQEFDASFFRIAPREAISLDPQQRLLLEVTWEALENAAIAADKIQGSQTGVFIGICGIDYWHQLLNRHQTTIDAYLTTGNTHSLASGRLSYFLGLTGSSISVDTACSSSLVAVHLAIQSLRQKECNLAIAGGVNRIVSPQASINFSQARMLSPQGRCHTFDAAANGFVRAEGCGVVVLKRLSDAIQDRDRILALLKGSAVNQDGRTSGITAPSSLSQQAVIRQALVNSRVEAQDINYIETHGTGTALGDAIEVEALSAVFTSPIILGAVKTNIGHCEGASGIASLIKVILALEHETIPANLHFNQPNPQINWQKLPFELPKNNIPWSKSDKLRLAGVSAFGFSGTNTHVIVQESGVRSQELGVRSQELGVRSQESRRQGRDDFDLEQTQEYLFTLSATTEKALGDLVQRYREYLVSHASVSIKDICLTTNTGRSHFKYRLAIITESVANLQQKLEAIINLQTPLHTWQGKANPSNNEPVVFYLTESSSYDVRTIQQLYQTQSSFRDAISQCGEILQPFLDKSLLEILFGERGREGDKETRRQEIEEINGRKDTQGVLFSLQYALAKLWQCWGIQPDGIMGIGIGEYVAGCVAGVFGLENALQLILTPEGARATVARQISYNSPQISLISTVTGEEIGDRVTDFNYWSDRFLSTVNNSEAWQQENTFYLPISASTNWQEILSNLAQIYTKGIQINWHQFSDNIPYQKTILPNYPFQRKKYWL
jgi:acyl transferase domain-containing protein